MQGQQLGPESSVATVWVHGCLGALLGQLGLTPGAQVVVEALLWQISDWKSVGAQREG